MGYTHYWNRPFSLPEKEWKEFTEEVKGLRNAIDQSIVICGWNPTIGEYDPQYAVVTDDKVAFNGYLDLSHEDFVIERTLPKSMRHQVDKQSGLVFEFCKTANKPYDILACLILLSLKKHFMSQVTVSSDGDKEDWKSAIDLYHKLTDAHILNFELLTYDPYAESEA